MISDVRSYVPENSLLSSTIVLEFVRDGVEYQFAFPVQDLVDSINFDFEIKEAMIEV